MLLGIHEKEEQHFLLKLIVELLVAIRGFTFVSGCMEEHKKVNETICNNQNVYKKLYS